MRDLWKSSVSGEFMYLGGSKLVSSPWRTESAGGGPAFGGNIRPENPTVRPALSAMGNIILLRNLSVTLLRSLRFASPASIISFSEQPFPRKYLKSSSHASPAR